MAFMTIDKSAAGVTEKDGSKYINTSGIYPVKINFASVVQGDNGAVSVTFNFDYEGGTSTLYGLGIKNNDGSDNFRKPILNKLAIIAGLEGSIADPVTETRTVGKDKTAKEFMVLQDFTGLECLVRVKQTYSLYNGKLQDRKTIEGFYRLDGATAEEIINNTEIGVKLKKDKEYADVVIYDNGLTEEKVKELKKASANGTAASATASTTKAPTANPFA